MTRPSPYRAGELAARHRATADRLRRGAAAAESRAAALALELVLAPSEGLDAGASAAREIADRAWDRLFAFLDRTGLSGTNVDPRSSC